MAKPQKATKKKVKKEYHRRYRAREFYIQQHTGSDHRRTR